MRALKIIVLEEDETVIKDFYETFEANANIEILSFYNSLNLIKTVKNGSFDLAYVSLDSKSFNGFEMAYRILKIIPTIRLVFITRFNHFATEALETSYLEYVLKPIDPSRLRLSAKSVKKNSRNLLIHPENQVFIRMFGHLNIKINQTNLRFIYKHEKEILLYLILNHSRAHLNDLIEELYSDLPKKEALALLETHLFQLRKAVIHLNKYIEIARIQQTIFLNMHNVYIDYEEFISKDVHTMSLNECEKMIDLSDKGFLTEFNGSWVIKAVLSVEQKRNDILQKYLQILKSKNDFDKIKKVIIQLNAYSNHFDHLTFYSQFIKDHYSKKMDEKIFQQQ